MSVLKPETSVLVGLATVGVVYSVYANALPTVADIRVGQQGDRDIAAAEKLAAWSAAGVVAGIALITKDYTVLTLGGASVVLLSWWHRHANEVNPLTGVAARIGGEAAMYLPDDGDEMAAAA